MQFGLPKRGQRKKEKYPDTPVLTIHKTPSKRETSKRETSKFSLNKKACELLGITPTSGHEVNFSFVDMEAGILYFAASQQEGFGFRLTKTATFANAKLHKFLNKNYEIINTENQSVHLKLVTSQVVDGLAVYSLQPISTASSQNHAVIADENVEEEADVDSDVTEDETSDTEIEDAIIEPETNVSGF